MSRSPSRRTSSLKNGISISEPSAAANGLWLHRLVVPARVQAWFRQSGDWARLAATGQPNETGVWSVDLRSGEYIASLDRRTCPDPTVRRFLIAALRAHQTFAEANDRLQPVLRIGVTPADPTTMSEAEAIAQMSGARWLPRQSVGSAARHTLPRHRSTSVNEPGGADV